jgi:hypothetical protein
MLENLKPKILATGIDSLNVGLGINRWLFDSEMVDKLKYAKESAGGQLFGGKGVTVEFCGQEFNMLAKGSQGYEYVMHNDDIRLCMAENCQGGRIFPEALVQFNSAYLWGKGYEKAYLELLAWVRKFAVIDSERINRVDLCVDLETKLPVIDVKRDVVTRSRKKVDYFQAEHYTDGLRDTGYRFGSGGIMGRIYDKSYEIKHSDKSWFKDIWKAGGYDGVSAVTRVEGQFRRPFLKDMSVNSYSKLIQCTPDIWRVFTSKFISLRTPDLSDSNNRRWPVSPFWETAIIAGNRFGECLGIERYKQKQGRIEPLMAQMKGLMVSEVALDSKIRGEYFAKSRLKSEINDYLDSQDFSNKVMERRGRYANMK